MKKLLPLFLYFFSATLFAQTIGLETFATGFSSPVGITNAGDARLFVVERGGLIKIINANGTVNPTPFLTLTSSTVLSGGERGLLGLAFHPDYATNGYFYVNYTRAGDGATTIARYNVNATNPDIADSSSGQVLFNIAQPFSNHNGGSVVFGPDGYLYIGTGDGGSGGDPNNNGQNVNALLGKMLRIDVNSGALYGIPADNPDLGQTAGVNEIWAVGLRNPWKFSFDRTTGDLWIADVGQVAIEEINKAASTDAGLNYGWRCYEGNSPYLATPCGPASDYKAPIATYTHSVGYSITGGYVYRGATYPNLISKYIFADYGNNKIGYINNNGGTITWTSAFSGGNFVAFGENLSGEIFVAGITSGIISKIKDTTLGISDFTTNGFTLYPNPSSTYFTLSNNNNLSLDKVMILDVTGKVLMSQTPTSSESIYDVSNLSLGMYIVQVKTESGKTFSTKLMVK